MKFTSPTQQTDHVSVQKPRLVVTVCAECHRASCFQGLFYCDEAKNAGTVDLPLSTLKRKGLENPSYWKGARMSENFSIEVKK